MEHGARTSVRLDERVGERRKRTKVLGVFMVNVKVSGKTGRAHFDGSQQVGKAGDGMRQEGSLGRCCLPREVDAPRE